MLGLAELTNFQTYKFTNLAKTSLTNTFHNHVQRPRGGGKGKEEGSDGDGGNQIDKRVSKTFAALAAFARCQFNKFAIFALKFVTKPNETSPNSSKRVEVVSAVQLQHD